MLADEMQHLAVVAHRDGILATAQRLALFTISSNTGSALLGAREMTPSTPLIAV